MNVMGRRDPKQAANEARRRLGFSLDVFFPAKNIFDLIEQNEENLTIVRSPLEFDNTSAIIVSVKNRFFILVDSSKSLGRQVFSLAHEYAHYVEHSGHMNSNIRGGISDPRIEQWADEFATEFLMPREAIVRWLYLHRTTKRSAELSLLDFLRLQQAMGVSFEAALYRLRKLLYISRSQFEKWRLLSPTSLAKKFGLPLDLYLPDYMVKMPEEYYGLWIEAYESGKVSYQRLVEALNASLDYFTPIIEKNVGVEDVI